MRTSSRSSLPFDVTLSAVNNFLFFFLFQSQEEELQELSKTVSKLDASNQAVLASNAGYQQDLDRFREKAKRDEEQIATLQDQLATTDTSVAQQLEGLQVKVR